MQPASRHARAEPTRRPPVRVRAPGLTQLGSGYSRRPGRNGKQLPDAERDQHHHDGDQDGVEAADVERPEDDPQAQAGGGGQDQTHRGRDATDADPAARGSAHALRPAENARTSAPTAGNRVLARLALAGGAHQPAADDHAVGPGGRRRGRLLGRRDAEADRHRHRRAGRGPGQRSRRGRPAGRRARRSSRSARPCRRTRAPERRSAPAARSGVVGATSGTSASPRSSQAREHRRAPPRAAGRARSAR